MDPPDTKRPSQPFYLSIPFLSCPGSALFGSRPDPAHPGSREEPHAHRRRPNTPEVVRLRRLLRLGHPRVRTSSPRFVRVSSLSASGSGFKSSTTFSVRRGPFGHLYGRLGLVVPECRPSSPTVLRGLSSRVPSTRTTSGQGPHPNLGSHLELGPVSEVGVRVCLGDLLRWVWSGVRQDPRSGTLHLESHGTTGDRSVPVWGTRSDDRVVRRQSVTPPRHTHVPRLR